MNQEEKRLSKCSLKKIMERTLILRITPTDFQRKIRWNGRTNSGYVIILEEAWQVPWKSQPFQLKSTEMVRQDSYEPLVLEFFFSVFVPKQRPKLKSLL